MGSTELLGGGEKLGRVQWRGRPLKTSPVPKRWRRLVRGQRRNLP